MERKIDHRAGGHTESPSYSRAGSADDDNGAGLGYRCRPDSPSPPMPRMPVPAVAGARRRNRRDRCHRESSIDVRQWGATVRSPCPPDTALPGRYVAAAATSSRNRQRSPCMTAHPASAAEADLPPLTAGPYRKRIGLISIVACLGGLLFGYDTGVSSGAEGPMSEELGLTLLQTGIVISSLVFAAAFGALIGGRLSDAIGRRTTIIVLSVMFFLGVVLVVTAPGFVMVVSGRIILGLAVGGASTVVPVYLAELAPYEIRGSITGRNELAIVVGQFAAFSVNAVLNATLGHVEGLWRIMFGICALPAVALFFGMMRMPESPRWLVEKGRDEDALAVLKQVRSEDRALAELRQVETIREEETGDNSMSFGAIFSNRWLRRIVFVGIGVSVTQQLTGINSIMYYGSRVLEESGFSET